MVWGMLVVHHGLMNACGEDAVMLGVHQNLRTNTFFLNCFKSEYGPYLLYQILRGSK